MNEADWLTATNTQEMFRHLQTIPEVSKRKLRLFACGCCRQAWHLLEDERSRNAVEIAEKRADGEESPEALVAAYRANDALRNDLASVPQRFLWQEGQGAAAAAVAHAGSGEECSSMEDTGETEGFEPLFEAEAAAECAARALALTGKGGPDLSAARAVNCNLLRDIVGPLPFRPLLPIDPTLLGWQNGALVHMANAVYEQRLLPSGEFDRDRTVILCDAMEEAGCTDASILSHLRGPGPHWRGCWCVDLLLGKEASP
jgi:hypothetical protein